MREIPEGGGIGAPNFKQRPFQGKLRYQFNFKRFGTSNPSSETKIEIKSSDTTGITIKFECYRTLKTRFLNTNILFLSQLQDIRVKNHEKSVAMIMLDENMIKKGLGSN